VNGERKETLISETLLEYNAPPATPRDEIWAAMQKRRKVVQPPQRRTPLTRWPAVAAAILLLGIGIGRISDRSVVDGSATRSVRVSTAGSRMFNMAAIPVLGHAEILLTRFRSESETPSRKNELKSQADELLGETRLLIDSPVADDPVMRKLLLDLELVLARITRYTAGDEGEAEWLRRDLENRTLLPRLRWHLPAGDTPVTL